MNKVTKDTRLIIRLADADKKSIERRAVEQKTTVSKLIRDTILGLVRDQHGRDLSQPKLHPEVLPGGIPF